MRSIKCGSCGLFNWAESGPCKRCGAELEAPYDYEPSYSGYAQQQQQQTYHAPYPSFAGVQMKKKSGLAIASMVFGILSVLPFTLFGFLGIGAITGLILGIVGYKRSKNRPMEYAGGGMAVAGIVLSSFALFIIIPLIFAIALPNLFASRRAADEASALSTLRKLHGAEATFQATTGNGRFGSMQELVNANLLEPAMLSGQSRGYNFVVRAEDTSFEATASPITYGATGTGKRSFYICEDGIIRAADHAGMEATVNDRPVENSDERTTESSYQNSATSEMAVIHDLRTIQTAQETYRATKGDGSYGSIEDLSAAGMLSPALRAGHSSGYTFVVRAHGETWEAVATPDRYGSSGTGINSYYIAQDGVIHEADRGGMEAKASDPPFKPYGNSREAYGW